MKNRNIILILFALGSFALCSIAQAVVPAPDGGYPGANTAEGLNALFSLTTGTANTAVGWSSLRSDVNGTFNTAVGAAALQSNTGDQGTGDGVDNTAVGAASLLLNATGSDNTAVGAAALLNNIDGSDNTAIGVDALYNNGDGFYNTAVGTLALLDNISGERNTAIGRRALENSTGDFNTALGYNAGASLTTGNGNVYIGYSQQGALANEDDQTYIRNINTQLQSFIAGTNNYVTVRMTDGRLGYTAIVSSRRYKENIKPMDKVSEAILALKPVTFRLKKEFDDLQLPGFGLIAEEVEKVNPDLVTRNAKGQAETVRYEAVNAMLLNEFLKEHKKVAEQETKIDSQQASIGELKSTVAQQQKGMEILTAQLKEQAAQIQKVSAQLAVGKPATTVVLNKP
jgi:uncharacterized coiled-coil protein SlyX